MQAPFVQILSTTYGPFQFSSILLCSPRCVTCHNTLSPFWNSLFLSLWLYHFLISAWYHLMCYSTFSHISYIPSWSWLSTSSSMPCSLTDVLDVGNIILASKTASTLYAWWNGDSPVEFLVLYSRPIALRIILLSSSVLLLSIFSPCLLAASCLLIPPAHFLGGDMVLKSCV